MCSTGNVDLVRAIGADHVVDYTQEDFTRGKERYDLILDNVGNHSLSDFRRALTPEGTFQSVGAQVGGWFGGLGNIAKVLVTSLFARQILRPFVSLPNYENLVALKELVEAGRVTPAIDKTYRLSEAPEAMVYVGSGHARAKVVITV